ncbi:CIR protein PIR protein [Plasmodium vinckei brucechwatti]|uniref:CIR protein PIR protein n=1 Tax=Plasmodium vinckei brucechwatti TaxID=119398 RepID=A0A6V7S2Z0_PLAVN|nr:CIR protein PIR protein [Plasmodium vinckei brucechwatti]
MGQSYSNIKDVYKEINTIDGGFGVKMQNGNPSEYANELIRKYCYLRITNGYGVCFDYLNMASSGVINLLKSLEKYGLEYDKLAEYAILFLSYKLNESPDYRGKKLNVFYTKRIGDKHFNEKVKDSNSMTYKDIIDKKKDLMNMNTNEISKFNGPFSILCKLYNEINKSNMDCNKCSNDANEFVKNFKELNNDSNINGNTSYIKLLSTLSNDYDNFKIYFAEKCNDCNDLPTLPKVKTPPSKLIPGLSVVSVIPFFLGIAYKYSLFGVDKLFQRQYIRKKLKKVKKKLKLNI